MNMKMPSKTFLAKLVSVTIAAFAVLNFAVLSSAFSKILVVLQPVFIGIVLALILNVPMKFFESKLLKKIRNEKLKRMLALSMSIIAFAGIFALVFGLAVPSAIESIRSIYAGSYGNYWNKLASDSKIIAFFIKQIRLVYEKFVARLNDYVPKMLAVATNVLKLVANLILGVGVAIMLLSDKRGLKGQIKKLLSGVFKDQEKIKRFAAITDIALNKFSRYLGGQVIEAVILGGVCYLCMLILRLPYAPLVSLIIGFVNLIPIIGAYVGGALGAILIFSVSPAKALVFVIFVIILQQVEAFTTYPIIVGRYVGLNGFWIMVSIIVWGGLFGFWGVFLGVPLTAFLHDHLKDLLYPKEQAPVLLPGKAPPVSRQEK